MPARTLAMLVALIALFPASARAECIYKPFEYFPEKNDGVVVELIVKSGTTCAHNFKEGPGYAFTSVTFERSPEHGSLGKAGALRFIYRPARSFKGKDAYMFKICATKGGQKGCSAIAFVATVQ